MNASAQIGLKNLVYAIMSQDDQYGAAYNVPVTAAGIIKAKISPKVNSATSYNDDGPDETASSMGEVDVEIEIKELPIDIQAAWLGHTVQNGVLIKKTTDNPPYLAIGFKAQKADGTYRYKWLLKGKFMVPGAEHETKTDSPKFQNASIKGTFVRRKYDNAWEYTGDEADPAFIAGGTWFNAVFAPATDVTVPTVVTTPANNATAVAISAAPSGVFSENVVTADITTANVRLMKSADGSIVAGTLTYNPATKTMVFTPSANLSAATVYLWSIANIRDMAGNLIAPVTTKFTTA